MTLACSFEKKHLNQALQDYTYDQFMAQLSQMFKSGRYLWFFCGNIDHNTAVKTVETVRSKLNLSSVDIYDTIEVRPIALEAGRALALESPLADSANNNSCTVTYF